jgi:hypothetical protein
MPSTRSPRRPEAFPLPLRAAIIAEPVLAELEAAGHRGTVLGTAGGALHVSIDDFVVALTPRAGALLPNAVALLGDPGPWPPPGTRVRLALAGAPALWDPTLPAGAPAHARQFSARGSAVLQQLGLTCDGRLASLAAALVADDPGAWPGAQALLGSVNTRQASLLGRAARLLVGRGQGLTPRCDDLLAGVAGAVAALAPAAGWSEGERGEWLRALQPVATRDRTSALSATLLQLAATGRLLEPAHGVLEFGRAGDAHWRAALHRLVVTGHSTGRAYGAAMGAAMVLLGDTA